MGKHFINKKGVQLLWQRGPMRFFIFAKCLPVSEPRGCSASLCRAGKVLLRGWSTLGCTASQWNYLRATASPPSATQGWTGAPPTLQSQRTAMEHQWPEPRHHTVMDKPFLFLPVLRVRQQRLGMWARQVPVLCCVFTAASKFGPFFSLRVCCITCSSHTALWKG